MRRAAGRACSRSCWRRPSWRLRARSGSRCRTRGCRSRWKGLVDTDGQLARVLRLSGRFSASLVSRLPASRSLRNEALETRPLRSTAGTRHSGAVVVGIEVTRNEAHLVLTRDSEVDGMVVGILPRAREAESLARLQPHRLREPADTRMLPAGRVDQLAHIVAGGVDHVHQDISAAAM